MIKDMTAEYVQKTHQISINFPPQHSKRERKKQTNLKWLWGIMRNAWRWTENISHNHYHKNGNPLAPTQPSSSYLFLFFPFLIASDCKASASSTKLINHHQNHHDVRRCKEERGKKHEGWWRLWVSRERGASCENLHLKNVSGIFRRKRSLKKAF